MLTWPSHFEGIKIKISELSKCGFSCECTIFSQIYIVHMAKLSVMPNYSKDLFGGSCENCWHTPVLGGQSCYAVRNLTGVTLCEILRSIVWHTGMACIANTHSHIRNRNWQRRSLGARVNRSVDLNKLDQFISSPLFAWSWQNLFCGNNWQLGLFRKSWFQKFRIPLKQKLLTQSFARSLITCTVCKSVLHIKANYDLYSSTDRTPSKDRKSVV